jgi:hypothetical protein
MKIEDLEYVMGLAEGHAKLARAYASASGDIFACTVSINNGDAVRLDLDLPQAIGFSAALRVFLFEQMEAIADELRALGVAIFAPPLDAAVADAAVPTTKPERLTFIRDGAQPGCAELVTATEDGEVSVDTLPPRTVRRWAAHLTEIAARVS